MSDPTMLKKADDNSMSMQPGGQPGQDAQFERTFADLAYAFLKDRAPKLLDYLVGFQVIDKNDDATKAAGIFGFKMSKQWYYAPVFFINGELKGYELLYIKAQDSFVPLQENWVNYLINRKPIVLGESHAFNAQEIRNIQPDFTPFRDSPFSKSSNFASEAICKARGFKKVGYYIQGEPFDIEPAMACFTISPTCDTYKQAAARTSLSAVLKDMGLKAVTKIASRMQSNPLFARSVLSFYDLHDILPAFPKKAEVVAPAKVRTGFELIKLSEKRNLLDSELTDAERDELVADGITIRDHRDGTTQVFSAVLETQLTNPTETGVYQLLVRPAQFIEVLIIVAPKTIGTGVANICTVITKAGKGYTNVLQGALCVKPVPDPRTEYLKWFKDFPTRLENLKDSAIYSIVAEDGTGTIPFQVEQKITEDGDTLYFVRACTSTAGDCGLAIRSHARNDYSYAKIEHSRAGYDIPRKVSAKEKDGRESVADAGKIYGVRRIVISKTATGLVNIGDTLFVGNSCKAAKIDSTSVYGDQLGYPLGTMSDIEHELYKSGAYHPFQVYSDGVTYQVKDAQAISKSLTKISAIEYIVRHYNTDLGTAKAVVKQASADGVTKQLVKLSANNRVGGEAYAPDIGAILQTTMPSYSDRNRAIVQPAVDGAYRVDSMLPPPGYKDRALEPLDESATNLATRAAKSGQKEVFDTAIVSSLVKAVDIGTHIDKYLGDLMVGVDRIGRLLFMFYWHNDKFVDRYGETEMSELEDSLKNTFKSSGDLVLFLKKKTAEPEMSMMGSDVDLDGIES